MPVSSIYSQLKNLVTADDVTSGKAQTEATEAENRFSELMKTWKIFCFNITDEKIILYHRTEWLSAQYLIEKLAQIGQLEGNIPVERRLCSGPDTMPTVTVECAASRCLFIVFLDELKHLNAYACPGASSWTITCRRKEAIEQSEIYSGRIWICDPAGQNDADGNAARELIRQIGQDLNYLTVNLVI
ncbi:hypothetical protein BDN72DRAFT_935046 [Pluteus cervinus]|uniref:Uncharacterized protein n=1 Tax=Pluteus cervinus TaxID=181527 RepID=A0ACD3A7I4_9AGAR|nr:hypothetical protein BDN72DRAFT_935046 [Pluteus cervinus]